MSINKYMFEKLTARIVVYVVGALLVTGVGLGGYYAWKRSIERQAQQELLVKQLEVALGKLEDERRKLEEVTRATEEVRKVLKELADEIEAKSQQIEDEIIDPAEDRESSSVLKDVIKALGDGN